MKVEVQGVGTLDFPDDAKPDEISKVLNERYSAPANFAREAASALTRHGEQPGASGTGYLDVVNEAVETGAAKAINSPLYTQTATLPISIPLKLLGKKAEPGKPMVDIKRIPFSALTVPGLAARLLAPKVVQGVEEEAGKLVGGLTTPGSALTLPIAAESKPVQAYFAAQSASQIPEQYQRVKEAKGPTETAAAVTGMGANVAMTGLMGKGILREGTIPAETIKQGEQNASSIEKAAEVHGDLQPPTVESAAQVPAKESGAGIRPPEEAQKGEVLLNKSDLSADELVNMRPDELVTWKKNVGLGTEIEKKIAQGITDEDVPKLELERDNLRAKASALNELMAKRGKVDDRTMRVAGEESVKAQTINEILQEREAFKKAQPMPEEATKTSGATETPPAVQPELVGSLGPGAARAGEPGTYSAIQQLADQIRVTTKEAPVREQIGAIDRAKAGLSKLRDVVKEKAATAVAVKDAIWDAYSKPAKFTDEKAAVGKWTYALQKADFEARDFAKSITKEIPNKIRREGITNWIQADGDKAVLRQRADASKPDVKRGYEAALNLTPKELEIAQLVREYYDRQLERGIHEGILKEGLDNYVTQVWKKENPVTRKLKNELSSEKLQPNFKFARQRIFDSYFEGEQAGYAPANKDIGPLLALYDQSFNKAIAARAFLKELHEGEASDGRPLVEVSGSGKIIDRTGKQGEAVVIKPKIKPEEASDYRVIDHPALRGWKWLADVDGKPVLLQGDLLVHPEIYQKLRNRLSISAWRQNPVGRAVLGAQSTFKQTLLSVSGFHQAQETLHALGHRINPARLEKIDFTDPITKAGVEHGLQLADYHAMEAFSEGLASGPLTNKIPIVGRRILKPYTEWLFQDYIPRLKLTMFKHALERNMERYKAQLDSGKITRDQILDTTANQANAAFGELNYRYMGRNPTLQDTLRAFLLAPDFLEARGRFVGQALKPHGREQLVALGLLAATQYITARVLNQILDDDPHWEAKHAFSAVYKGHSYTLRSVPGDIVHLFSDPRSFWYHRLSPIIGRGTIEAFTGRDDRGVKRDAMEQVKDMASNIVPISLRKRDDMAHWEMFLNSVGVGARRYDAVNDIADKVKGFKEKTQAKEPFEFVYDPEADRHRPLRVAIANEDADAVRKEYLDLVKTDGAKKVRESIDNYFSKPFTGSKSKEQKFIQSLDATGRREYDDARNLQKRRLRFFLTTIAQPSTKQP